MGGGQQLNHVGGHQEGLNPIPLGSLHKISPHE